MWINGIETITSTDWVNSKSLDESLIFNLLSIIKIFLMIDANYRILFIKHYSKTDSTSSNFTFTFKLTSE